MTGAHNKPSWEGAKDDPLLQRDIAELQGTPHNFSDYGPLKEDTHDMKYECGCFYVLEREPRSRQVTVWAWSHCAKHEAEYQAFRFGTGS